ncbi:AAA family ATPase [Lignipirellula cremea]|uniref:ATP-dependent Clp protease ATP-binding subunit ClpC n=1 Tax=Lignipirellula cremea TaxID=2528010 RepID=A0A518DR67_9BACT|nr:AAA family ATPase [Lignipirellula cremea]QDU94335.1 ATP-dependent Clp protease ATP-binding subunit ClpC [Lignipirellula cremea]
MPLLPLRFDTVLCRYENDVRLHWPLFFREVSALGMKADRLEKAIRQGAVSVLRGEQTLQQSRRRAGVAPELAVLQVSLSPPRRERSWSTPVELELGYLRWPHGAAWRAYVPALDIEIVARKEEELAALVAQQVQACMMRRGMVGSLQELTWLHRIREISTGSTEVETHVPSPRQVEQQAGNAEPAKALLKAAERLDKNLPPEVFEVDDTVDRMGQLLTAHQPQSVLLVGPSGVGKSAVFGQLVRRRQDCGLGRYAFWSTTGSRLVSGMTGFGMWQDRCREIGDELRQQKAVLHLGNLLELMEVGKYEGNDQGVADFFRPRLERGELLAVAECTPEQLAMIERKSPNLLQAFAQIRLEEPSSPKMIAILQQAAAQHPRSDRVRIAPEALEWIDRVHRRYATYSARPGRPLRFLRNLLEDAPAPAEPPPNERTRAERKSDSASRSAANRARLHQVELTQRDAMRAFSIETGLPLAMIDPQAPLDLAALRTHFSNRLIGQTEAIDLIVDLIAVMKAGLTRPQRPIASLLFIGPTGVGKTEMAKALAEYLYHDAQRMTRIDMSEFSDPLAADRLLGGSFQGEGILTAKVREQPFGVVLLDEFEKAHPRLHDVLLQVLGEGRLTDAAGRLADFSNSVIIMTSNLGAESRRRLSLGFAEAGEPTQRVREHFLAEVRRFVRPEFFNRIDRIVPFDSLSPAMITRIAQRELAQLQQRDGVRFRPLQLKLDDGLAERLALQSYDPRYGARPLKRAIERELLAPLADQLNGHDDQTPLHAQAEWPATGRLTVRVRPAPRDADLTIMQQSAGDLADQFSQLRRQVQRLMRCAAVLQVRNQLFRLRREEKRWRARNPQGPQIVKVQKELASLDEKKERIAAVRREIFGCEERLLMNCYTQQSLDLTQIRSQLAQGKVAYEKQLLELYGDLVDQQTHAGVVIYSEEPRWLGELAAAYYAIAVRREMIVKLWTLSALTDAQREAFLRSEDHHLADGGELVGLGASWTKEELALSKKTLLVATERTTVDADLFHKMSLPTLGVFLGIHGPMAPLLWGEEQGVHQLVAGNKRQSCLVQAAHLMVEHLIPPDRIDRRGTIVTKNPRRTYEKSRSTLHDRLLGQSFRWTSDDFSPPLESLMMQAVLSQAREKLGLAED